jgi:hypothetical protein
MPSPTAPLPTAAGVTASCAICGTPLTLLDAPTSPTCARQPCRWAYQTAPAEARCRVCGRLLAPAQRAERLCASAACRSTRLTEVVAEGARQAQERQRAQEELERLAAALRADAAAALGVARAEAFPVVITPSFGNAPRRRLPQHRRRALRAHVSRLVDAALAARSTRAADAARATPPAPDEPLPPALAAVLGGACATCGGFCCHRGGDKAYLTVDTVARWMDAHPELGRDAAVEAYVARAGGTTYEESCIYHRRTGCALPRAMRSDTCNRFFCGPLVELQRAVAVRGGEGGESEAPRAFFAASLDGRIEGAAFVDARTVRVVPRRPPPTSAPTPAAGDTAPPAGA